MTKRELNHSTIALPSVGGFREKQSGIGVWADTPDENQPPHVTLDIDYDDHGAVFFDLLPDEARALAALLVAAANHQSAA